MTPVDCREVERISDAHYVVHDFEAASASGSGAATDTEDCIKVEVTGRILITGFSGSLALDITCPLTDSGLGRE